MKLNKLAVSVLSAGLIMSLGTGSMMVSAEEGNQDKSSAESEVKVQFTVPEEEAAKLYDPKNPSDPLDEEKYGEVGNITGQTGPLSLNYVTHLNFGTQEIDVTEVKYELFAQYDHFLQVTDRRGTGAGWSVTAKLNTFKDIDGDDTETLPGSTVSFKNGSAATPNESLKDQQPHVKNPTLTAGGDAMLVAKAEEDKGRGAWLIRWLKGEDDSPKVKLEVAADAASPGNHITTINWTLENGPYQSDQAATNAR